MSEPRDSPRASVKQSLIDSYVNNSTVIGYAEHVHVSSAERERVPSIEELTSLNPGSMTRRVRECLLHRQLKPDMVKTLARIPPEIAFQLLARLQPVDFGLWGVILLYQESQQCRQFLDKMTDEQRSQTVQSAAAQLSRLCANDRASDAANVLLGTDQKVAIMLLAHSASEDCVRILSVCRSEDRQLLLDAMRPQTMYRLISWAVAQSVVDYWLGFMRPDRIAAALAGAEAPEPHVFVAVVRELLSARGAEKTAQVLNAANLFSESTDTVFRAIDPVMAIELLELGRRHGKAWERQLTSSSLARIVKSLNAVKAAELLEHAAPERAASTLSILSLYHALPIMAAFTPSAFAECLAAFEPRQAVRLFGMREWRVPFAVDFGDVRTGSGGYQLRDLLEPAGRATLLARAAPDVIGRVLSEMPRSVAASLLVLMPAPTVRQVVAKVPAQALVWLRTRRPGTAIKLLSILDAEYAVGLLSALSTGRAVRLLAMTRMETIEFVTAQFHDEMKRAAATNMTQRGQQSMRAIGRMLSCVWRMRAALWIAEANPMAVLTPSCAVRLWQCLDPKVCQRLRENMSEPARRRLEGSADR